MLFLNQILAKPIHFCQILPAWVYVWADFFPYLTDVAVVEWLLIAVVVGVNVVASTLVVAYAINIREKISSNHCLIKQILCTQNVDIIIPLIWRDFSWVKNFVSILIYQLQVKSK